jgi:eukaryotic-like serine/threonine-protein kinase
VVGAAEKLQGLTLSNGWKVIDHMPRSQAATGGTFSQSYIVERNGKRGFLKAFDFWPAFEAGVDTAAAIQILTAAYNHEKDILAHCENRRLSRVVLAMDHGDVQIPTMGQMEGRVFYLIFEMADGDVRCQMDTEQRFDVLWCMRALKDVSLGLWQIDREMIAHQDTKPSNVLNYDEGGFKIADFGRSSRRGHPVWYDDHTIAGDKTYAPPELLYGFTHPEFAPRRIGCDLYMLGNLAAFLFSGVNVTAQLLANLDRQHHPNVFASTYAEVLPYLQDSFVRVLEELAPLIDLRVRDEVLPMIRALSNPDLSNRGHPRGLGRYNQYSLERYVTELDLASKRLEVRVRVGRVA